jgi:hypothetical protein
MQPIGSFSDLLIRPVPRTEVRIEVGDLNPAPECPSWNSGRLLNAVLGSGLGLARMPFLVHCNENQELLVSVASDKLFHAAPP